MSSRTEILHDENYTSFVVLLLLVHKIGVGEGGVDSRIYGIVKHIIIWR